MSEKDEKQKPPTPPTRSFVEETEVPKKPVKLPSVNPEKYPLFVKMDKMIEIMEVTAFQLTRIADKLTGQKTRYDEEGKAIVKTEKPVTPKEIPTPAPTPATTPSDEVQKIVDLIPSALRAKLEFVRRENDVRVNIEYMPSEDFAKVAGIFRDVGGVYNSAGKDSHFIVPFLKEETKEPTPPSMTSTEAAKQLPAIQMVKDAFTEDLRNMLVFDETSQYVTIKPRQYLGSENFAKIASVVRELGGEYISAGKESHFRVKK